MSPRESWVKVHQAGRLELAHSIRLPHWLRLAFLAEARMAEDGHARFERGEVGLHLGTDGDTGECTPVDRYNVRRAIREAVSRGLLLPGSGTRCLLLPQHRVTKGRGQRLTDCPHHGGNVGQTLTHKQAERGSNLDPQRGSNLDNTNRSDQHKYPRPSRSLLPRRSA